MSEPLAVDFAAAAEGMSAPPTLLDRAVAEMERQGLLWGPARIVRWEVRIQEPLPTETVVVEFPAARGICVTPEPERVS